MKSSLLFILMTCALAPMALGQNLILTPSFNVGDRYICELVTWEEEFKNNNFVGQDTTVETITWTVQKVNDAAVEFLLHTKNPMYDGVNELMDTPYINDTLTYIDAVCLLDKETGKLSMTNWPEISRIYTRDLLQMKEFLQNRDNEMASLLHLIIDPYYKMLGTQEGVESLVIKPIQFLYKPYYKKFAANDTIAESTSHENPFQPDQMLSTTEYMHWLQVQNAADHTIEYVIDFDMTEVKKMMIQMVEQMNAAFGGDTPKNEKKLKEISSLDMTMTNHSLFHFDLVSHAITTCDVFMQLDGHDGRKPRKSIKHLKYTITAELQ